MDNCELPSSSNNIFDIAYTADTCVWVESRQHVWRKSCLDIFTCQLPKQKTLKPNFRLRPSTKASTEITKAKALMCSTWTFASIILILAWPRRKEGVFYWDLRWISDGTNVPSYICAISHEARTPRLKKDLTSEKLCQTIVRSLCATFALEIYQSRRKKLSDCWGSNCFLASSYWWQCFAILAKFNYIQTKQ